jgi:hypothetical protein
MPVVDRIEADQRREQAPVRFSRLIAEQETPGLEPRLHTIEHGEDLIIGVLVRELAPVV